MQMKILITTLIQEIDTTTAVKEEESLKRHEEPPASFSAAASQLSGQVSGQDTRLTDLLERK
jgi:hypothetical protein